MEITIGVEVSAPLEEVWKSWITAEDITKWNFAIDEWHCPSANIDFQVGGKFNYKMEAKDGSMGFDFTGVFTEIDPQKTIVFKLDDNRRVVVEFVDSEKGVKVSQTFEAEDENSAEQQRQGWLSILGNFKYHVEGKHT